MKETRTTELPCTKHVFFYIALVLPYDPFFVKMGVHQLAASLGDEFSMIGGLPSNLNLRTLVVFLLDNVFCIHFDDNLVANLCRMLHAFSELSWEGGICRLDM